MNPPSSSSLLGPSNALSYSASSNSQQQQQYPPIQLPPPNLSSSSSSFPQAAPIPLPLSSLPSFDPGRRRSLSTLSAIAGAVGMDEYNHHHHHHHPSSSSSSSTWSASHQEGGGGATSYRFSTSSPVSSTRHLGTEPQAFALTSSNSASPGRSNWNPTTSSLRTEMTTTTTAFDQNHTSTGSTSDRYRNVEVAADVTRAASPRTTTAASSSVPSVSSLATSPSTTTLPASVKAPSPSTTPPIAHGLEDATTTISGDSTSYFEPFELDPPDGFPLLDLSYPPSLPPLAVLHHLVSTFFKRAAVPSTMLSKAKLLFALGLSPTDPRWPDEALLHSICAYACMFVSDETLGAGEYGGLGFDPAASGLRYWEIEGDATARDYHYKKAKDAIEQALLLNARRAASSSSSSMHHPRNLFQVLQAVVLVCYVAYLSAQFSDLWLLAGTATRLIAPLGLNHLEPWDFDRNRSGPPYQDWGIRVRKTERNELLGPAKDLAEHWERSCTFWLAFAVDRFASANTDWTTSIDEKDISTHLPCTATRPVEFFPRIVPCIAVCRDRADEEEGKPDAGAVDRPVLVPHPVSVSRVSIVPLGYAGSDRFARALHQGDDPPRSSRQLHAEVPPVSPDPAGRDLQFDQEGYQSRVRFPFLCRPSRSFLFSRLTNLLDRARNREQSRLYRVGRFDLKVQSVALGKFLRQCELDNRWFLGFGLCHPSRVSSNCFTSPPSFFFFSFSPANMFLGRETDGRARFLNFASQRNDPPSRDLDGPVRSEPVVFVATLPRRGEMHHQFNLYPVPIFV